MDNDANRHPDTWLKGASAIKTMFDSVRSAIGAVKEANELGGGNEQQKQVVTQALATASTSTVIAQAEMAKAFGYQLCKCDFPPTIMKTVGYFSRTLDNQHQDGDPYLSAQSAATTMLAGGHLRG